MPVTPWAADSLTHVQSPVVEHTWTVYDDSAASPVAIPGARNVKVTLDRGKVPFGELTFDVPLLTRSSDHTYDIPYSPHYRVDAGYIRDGVPDTHPILRAYLTNTELVSTPEGPMRRITAQTIDTVHEFPSNRSYKVSDSYTRVKQVTDAINASSTPWWRLIYITEEAGLPTPTSAQLSVFRNLNLDVGDTVGDFLRSLAASLGQWIRPDHRGTPPTNLIIGPPRVDASAGSTDVTPLVENDTLIRPSPNAGNVLDLTMSWPDSTGALKSARKVYPDPSLATAGVSWGLITVKPVSILARPANGTSLTATDPTAMAWLDKITRARGQHTFTGRAAYWLQPGDWLAIGFPYTDEGTNTTGHDQGPLDRIEFNLDSGTMSVTFDAIYYG